MEPTEVAFIIVLAIFNLFAGFGCAIPIAKLLSRIDDMPKKIPLYFIILIGIYLIECVAFSVGMATQVFSVGLAFVWGIVLGLWFRFRTSRRKALKIAFFLSLYSCLPTISFCIVLPVMWLVRSGNFLSAEEGMSFGLPNFLPWPLNTILGFCITLIISTVVLKTAITTCEVSLLVRQGKNREKNRSKSCYKV